MSDNENIIEILDDNLENYLDNYLKLTKINGKYNCVFHIDTNASMSIVPNNRHLIYCFSCNRAYSIFDIAHQVEGLPKSGEEFYLITIPHLCKALNIPYEIPNLTPEQKFKMQLYKAYEEATMVITNSSDSKLNDYLDARNISPAIARYMDIGAIKNFNTYKQAMLDLGYEEAWLARNDVDLLNDKIFNAHNLIMSIKNDKGRPIAFVARDMFWDKNSTNPKYINSRQSVIYQKGNTFYGFDKAIVNNRDLIIVEGYLDCVQSINNNITNVIALGGTALTDGNHLSHINLLRKYDIKNITLSFDSDDAGQTNLDKTLDIFVKYPEFNVKILQLPSTNGEKQDFDSYLNIYGRDKFLSIPKQSLFEYKLNKYSYDVNGEEIAKNMIQYIIAEPSFISHHVMATKLSERTGIPIEVIQKQIDAHFHEQDYRNIQKVHEFKRELDKSINNCSNLSELRSIVNNKLEGIQEEEIKVNEEDFNKQRIELTHEKFLSKEDNTFKLGKFNMLETALEGIPKGACMFGLAARSNVGKSSMVRELSLEILYNNPKAKVIMFSIDDAYNKCIATYITHLSGLTISEVRKPNRFINNDEYKMSKLENGWKRFKDLSDRLIIKDSSDKINSLFQIRKTLQYYKKKYPKDELFVIIDNFHNISSYSNLETTARMAEISQEVKQMTVEFDCPIAAIMELKKQESWKSESNTNDVKGSIDIVYDCDILIMINQDLNTKPDESPMFWYPSREERDFNGLRIKYPINTLSVVKTKESGYKGNIYMRFKTDEAKFYEITGKEVHRLVEANKAGSGTITFNDKEV